MSGLFGGGNQQGTNQTDPMEAGLRIQTSAYGMTLPVVYGKNRVTGNLMWYGAFTPVAHTTTTTVGSGKSSSTSSYTTWTYTCSFMLGLAEGQVSAVTAEWRDKDYYTSNKHFTLYNGSDTQAPWAYLSSYQPAQALNYRGISYCAAANYDLGSNSSLPNHSFELAGKLSVYGSGDANPKDVLTDILTNVTYGAGFPAAQIGDWTKYSQYCIGTSTFLSPVLDSQIQASEFVTKLMLLTNSAIYFSEGLLKITPYSDQSAGAYVPVVTPVYDITDDDYVSDGNVDPVIVTRVPQADAFNRIQIEFVNRANQYNQEISEAKDQANIETYGVRSKDVIPAHEITESNVAKLAAQAILQRSLYVRNNYQFRIGAKYALLEPTDYITITDSNLGLQDKPVRIISIEENDDYTYLIIAEDAPANVSSAAQYPVQTVDGHQNDYSVAPGNTSQPIVFEAPDALTRAGFEIWVGASGGDYWGGCEVWISFDGATYQQMGVIQKPAIQGVLSASLASHADPDTVDTLSVDLTMSRGALQNATAAQADNLATLCYVDGELVSYAFASLTAQYKYNLTYLRRGCYNSTISSHASGRQFAFIDNSFAKIAFNSDQIGNTIWIKLPAFNVYQTATQSLADISPFTYTISGSSLESPLPNVTGLFTNYNNAIGGITVINWSPIQDFRQPNIDYEIRMGDSWGNSKVLGRTPLTNWPAQGDGTYWVAARYVNEGVTVYSAAPSDIAIVGASLRNNVIAEYDEAATGWLGTVTGGAVKSGGNIQLGVTGGVVTNQSGTYTLPTSHIVNGGRVSPCNIAISYSLLAVSTGDNILTVANVLILDDVLHSDLGSYVDIQPEISFAGADGIYGSWQPYLPGYYNAQYFKARFTISTTSSTVYPVASEFFFSVDVPDRVDTGQVALLSTGSSVVYSSPFNGGLDGNSFPNVQITVVSAQQGDDVILTSQTNAGFTVQVQNGGVGVARIINWLAQGY